MKNKCKVCGKNAWSSYCFTHTPRKAIKRSAIKPSKRAVDKSIEKEETKEAMKLLFISMWRSKPHRSEVSGTSLGNSFSSIFFHHILPKSKYPEAILDEENIIILTGDEHANVENDMYKYEIINERRIYLKEKYNI